MKALESIVYKEVEGYESMLEHNMGMRHGRLSKVYERWIPRTHTFHTLLVTQELLLQAFHVLCIADRQSYRKMVAGAQHWRHNVEDKHYRHLLAFIFAIDKINRNPDILPNMTLGYHVYDSCGNVNKAIKDVLQILSGHKMAAPNYSCMEHGIVAGFIGDLQSATTLRIAQLLNIYGYTLVSYGARDTLLSDRRLYPNFFRTIPDNQIQYEAIVKLLEAFKWNWVGIVTSDDDYGERELQELSKYLTNHGICLEFKVLVSYENHKNIPRELQVPQGRCSKPCPPGTRKAMKKGYHSCCYDCVPCSDGEISVIWDTQNCQKCPDDEWTNEAKTKCVPRLQEFLSYQDNVAIFYIVGSLFFSGVSVIITGLFVIFRDTPIVTANNRNLSFVILLCLVLSMTSIFLFLGCPVEITCLLRQVIFGISFTIVLSSVLAKTIMVCIAFKATKPGSLWRKYLGVKLLIIVVLVCSSVQTVTIILWLSVSPPFVEYDMHSFPGKTIVQCNEGSVLAFYIMFGYMGLLAAVSFVLAFMVRTLPDIFNEAKYITFSMLVFCSVWIGAIPAYLSSKGKQMVIVEIFAILASSIGILGCIFFPKCYIILLRPEMNDKRHLFHKHLLLAINFKENQTNSVNTNNGRKSSARTVPREKAEDQSPKQHKQPLSRDQTPGFSHPSLETLRDCLSQLERHFTLFREERKSSQSVKNANDQLREEKARMKAEHTAALNDINISLQKLQEESSQLKEEIRKLKILKQPQKLEETTKSTKAPTKPMPTKDSAPHNTQDAIITQETSDNHSHPAPSPNTANTASSNNPQPKPKHQANRSYKHRSPDIVLVIDSNGKYLDIRRLFPGMHAIKIITSTIEKVTQVINDPHFTDPKHLILHTGTNDIIQENTTDQETITYKLSQLTVTG
ncbi:vomeronasal type-2 receptor 26-like [Hyperolius riggenbachi]|uniref:vomeronasal type-2 receptor 26-like n=1 Tax=Hyperolius riggenbachi TaxID=752182 RepID=UPI0035A3BE94